MIDKLSLTTFNAPDFQYLELHGSLTVDERRKKIYREMWELDRAVVLCRPHKFSEKTNMGIAYTKIDLNPKHFCCYADMWVYLCLIFGAPDLTLDSFKVSRIDLAADIEDLSIKNILCALHVKRISSDNFRFYKGTVYIGKNPEIVIYNKIKDIKRHVKEGYSITEYEQSLLDSGKECTRFEIRLRPEKMSLRDVLDNYVGLASYFDKIDIFNFNDHEITGFMQFIYRSINRKSRCQLESFKDIALVNKIKERFINLTSEWFKPAEEPF